MPSKLRLCAAVLALSLAALPADDPKALVEKAQRAEAKRDYKKAIGLLKKADQAFDNSDPNAPEHLEALEHMATLMKAQAAEESEQRGNKDYGLELAAWRRDAAPAAKRALEICDANKAIKGEDAALAFELEADILGRNEAGAPFWARATKIRAERVAHLQDLPPLGPTSEDTTTQPVEQIGGDVSQPRPMFKREPEYSQTARLMHYNGSVLFSLIIDQHGIPIHIRLLRGIGYGLDEKAAQTVSTWRFRPAMRNGKPVAVKANIEVNFRLL